MAIEMGFLGTVFSVSLQGCAPAVRVGGCVLMPALIIVGGVVGCLGAHALATHEALFVFVLAFGAAALLYLVTEELLLEHHEKGGEHVWYIDLMVCICMRPGSTARHATLTPPPTHSSLWASCWSSFWSARRNAGFRYPTSDSLPRQST
jgi:hypothetical protein